MAAGGLVETSVWQPLPTFNRNGGPPLYAGFVFMDICQTKTFFNGFLKTFQQAEWPRFAFFGNYLPTPGKEFLFGVMDSWKIG